MTRKPHEIRDPARELTDRLNAAFRRAGQADWLDVRERAGMTRTVWHWSRRRVLLVAGILVLAVGAAGASTGIIPWLNHKPVNVKTPSLAPPCRAENLWIRLSYQTDLNGLDGSLSLVNTSRRACSLVGRPGLTLVDPRVNKPRLFVEFTPPATSKPGSVDLAPYSLLRAVPPHRGAYLHFLWKNWCESGPPPAGLELRLPNGDRVVRSFSAFRPPANGFGPLYNATAPRCFRKRWQTGLYYEGLYPGWTPASVTSKYQLDATLPLRTSIITEGLPTIRKKRSDGRLYATYIRVRRGSVFHFQVGLRNTGKRPFRFERCPLYAERIAGLASNLPTRDIFALDCRPVGVMAPGKVAFFAMEILVPKNAPLGWNVLIWNLYNPQLGALPFKLVWIVP
jgi:hypothetical protein